MCARVVSMGDTRLGAPRGRIRTAESWGFARACGDPAFGHDGLGGRRGGRGPGCVRRRFRRPDPSPAVPAPTTPVSSPTASPSEGGDPSASVTEPPSHRPPPPHRAGSSGCRPRRTGDAHAKITDQPSNPTAYSGTSRHNVDFSYQIDKGAADVATDVRFRCTLDRPAHRGHASATVARCSTRPTRAPRPAPTSSCWAPARRSTPSPCGRSTRTPPHGLTDVTSSKASFYAGGCTPSTRPASSCPRTARRSTTR